MKFSQEAPTEEKLVHSYDEQGIVIQSGSPPELTTIMAPFLLTAKQVVERKDKSASLTQTDIDDFVAQSLEIVIVAQGQISRLSVEMMVAFAQHGIGIEQMHIGPACRTYNLLVTEGRKAGLLVMA